MGGKHKLSWAPHLGSGSFASLSTATNAPAPIAITCNSRLLQYWLQIDEALDLNFPCSWNSLETQLVIEKEEDEAGQDRTFNEQTRDLLLRSNE